MEAIFKYGLPLKSTDTHAVASDDAGAEMMNMGAAAVEARRPVGAYETVVGPETVRPVVGPRSSMGAAPEPGMSIVHPACQPPVFAETCTVVLRTSASLRVLESDAYSSDATLFVLVRAIVPLNEGNANAAKIATIDIAINSSIKVNAD